jgi:hypothetical protein
VTQSAVSETTQEPLNARQLAFARELGIAIAKGGRDDDLVAAYEAAGYSPDRGNARRLAADPRVKAIADKACEEALRLAGLHIGYLQAKALEILHTSPVTIHRMLAKSRQKMTLTEEDEAAIDAATWALSEFKIDKDGMISIKLPDKKGIIEMLAKQLGHGRDEPASVNLSLETLILQSMKDKQEAA